LFKDAQPFPYIDFCGHVMQVLGYVSRVKDVESDVDVDAVSSEQIESNAVRCPDTDAAEQMYKGMPVVTR